MDPGDFAFLSARVPAATRNRVKALAAAKGESVQEVVTRAIARLLDEEDRARPDLGRILHCLRGEARQLRQRGIDELWVFGSVARGEARPGSDVDLAVQAIPGERLSLVRLAGLGADLSELLGHRTDVVEWRLLAPQVAAAARRDAIRAF